MNETEIQIVGMSRSGNHPITDWIFAQARGRKVLLNGAEGKTNPFLTCRPLASGLGWRAEPDLEIEAERRGRHAAKKLLIHTYEDSWLGHAFSNELAAHREAWLGPSRRRIELVIVRDPYNLFASRLRMGCSLTPKVAPRMWKQHARVALRQARVGGAERRAILYNRWTSDRAYRREVAAFLGVPFTDTGFERVSDVGGGSSFDGTAFDGRADAMRTGERWRAYADDPSWRELFDAELVELSDRLFGETPGRPRDVEPPLRSASAGDGAHLA